MGTLLASAIVCIVGGVFWLTANAKLAELGRIAFFVGLFWLVAQLGAHSVRLP